MVGWVHVAVAAASTGILAVLLILFLRRRCCSKRRGDFSDATRAESLQVGIARLHHGSLHHQLDLDSKRRPNYYVFRRGVSTKPPLFNWADYPSLITDAVENGWSQFAFTGSMSSPSTRSNLLNLCAAGDSVRESRVEIGWEVCPGSADFMQKIRLISGFKNINSSHSSTAAATLIKTALPLPGPPLGNSPFPQEAYFEVTVSSNGEDGPDSAGKARKSTAESERAKLIGENSNVNANSDSLVHVTSSHGNNKLEELKLSATENGGGESVMLSIGLTGRCSLPFKLPGSYPGSIGFNSNGSVFLDGVKLVLESEKAAWGQPERVIGCGFNPSRKRVFFTVDAVLMRVIDCKSEEFGTPLYPTLAANTDATVLVNFGQSSFKYAPANAHRTPNPCFIGPLANSPAAALGYEDSKELFSMGRIDSQWLNRNATKSSHNSGIHNRGTDYDEESEADLFEIVLDSTGRSPNTVL